MAGYPPPPPPLPQYGATPPPPPISPMKTCLSCGQQVPIQYNVCPYCQKPTAPGTKGKSSTPLVGGIFLLLGGILAAGNGIYIAILGGTLGSMYGVNIGGIMAVCGAVEAIFGILALLGGIFAIQRKYWGIAIVGSIFGLISIGPLFLSSIFGLIGLILVATSKDEFN